MTSHSMNPSSATPFALVLGRKREIPFWDSLPQHSCLHSEQWAPFGLVVFAEQVSLLPHALLPVSCSALPEARAASD